MTAREQAYREGFAAKLAQHGIKLAQAFPGSEDPQMWHAPGAQPLGASVQAPAGYLSRGWRVDAHNEGVTNAAYGRRKQMNQSLASSRGLAQPQTPLKPSQPTPYGQKALAAAGGQAPAAQPKTSWSAANSPLPVASIAQQ